MKTLKFYSKLVPLILSREKTTTFRMFDDKNLTEGDVLQFVEKESGQHFGNATIVSVVEKRLCDMIDVDLDGHEKYESREKMYEDYRNIYGDRVTPEAMVKIVKFMFSRA